MKQFQKFTIQCVVTTRKLNAVVTFLKKNSSEVNISIRRITKKKVTRK